MFTCGCDGPQPAASGSPRKNLGRMELDTPASRSTLVRARHVPHRVGAPRTVEQPDRRVVAGRGRGPGIRVVVDREVRIGLGLRRKRGEHAQGQEEECPGEGAPRCPTGVRRRTGKRTAGGATRRAAGEREAVRARSEERSRRGEDAGGALGARRSALGARRSALGARRSALIVHPEESPASAIQPARGVLPTDSSTGAAVRRACNSPNPNAWPVIPQTSLIDWIPGRGAPFRRPGLVTLANRIAATP